MVQVLPIGYVANRSHILILPLVSPSMDIILLEKAMVVEWHNAEAATTTTSTQPFSIHAQQMDIHPVEDLHSNKH